MCVPPSISASPPWPIDHAHVETTTRWLVKQIIANQQKGKRIAWLTGGRMTKRFFGAKVLRRECDLFTRFGL